jgi:hypothetical protein
LGENYGMKDNSLLQRHSDYHAIVRFGDIARQITPRYFVINREILIGIFTGNAGSDRGHKQKDMAVLKYQSLYQTVLEQPV